MKKIINYLHLLIPVFIFSFLFVGNISNVQASCDTDYSACMTKCGTDTGCQVGCDNVLDTCLHPVPGGAVGGAGGAATGKMNLIPKKLGDEAGYSTGQSASLTLIVARIIRGFLGLAGIAVVGFVMYAGYGWMTAAGNEEKVASSKKVISQAIVGLAVILLSYAIADFAINSLVTSTTGATTTTIPASP